MRVQQEERSVVVTGDVLIECRLAQSRVRDGTSMDGSNAMFDPYSYMEMFREPVGAYALGDIISKALASAPPEFFGGRGHVRVIAPKCESFDAQLQAFGDPARKSHWQSFVLCAQYPKGKDDDRATWRVKQKLGIDRSDPNAPLTDLVPDDRGGAELVVIERAAGRGFESEPSLWPSSLHSPNRKDSWLLIEWSRPQFEQNSSFWKHAASIFEDRIVLVMTAEDLRLSGMHVSRALSWERTVEDLQRELCEVWESSLAGCAHLVVSFSFAGAVLFSEKGQTVKLIYDPAHIEGSWDESYEGSISGLTRCLTAGIALEMVYNPGKLTGNGIKAGVVAARRLLEHGFSASAEQVREDTSLPKDLTFPAQVIATELREALVRPPGEGDRIRIQAVDRQGGDAWRILDSDFPGRDFFEDACRIVTSGRSERPWPFPTDRIGNLFIAERLELENVRSVHNLMIDYLKSAVSTPLSVAVFGSPGAGKSFAIKEIAKQLSSERSPKIESPKIKAPEIKALTFNLSQFTGPDAIPSALHQVRDINLSGSMPLVFWDEFDAKYETELGWLHYFLAPMQDGEFLVGSNTHNVGRAIFVFAGGTHYNMQSFLNLLNEEKTVASEIVPDIVKSAKVPDFVSRLKGFVNVSTLDYSRRGDADTNDDLPPARKTVWEYVKPLNVTRDRVLNETTLDYEFDLAIMLRRAELLRSVLVKTAPHLLYTVPPKSASNKDLQRQLNVDRGLLGAFLLVEKFKYAARSMESIVKMSTLSRDGTAMYDRSSLPPVHQLELHVDATQFLALAQLQWAAVGTTA